MSREEMDADDDGSQRARERPSIYAIPGRRT